MPAKNTIKSYVENSYYHIYNRGIEGREIFLDQQDYKVFLNYIKQCLLPPAPIPQTKEYQPIYRVKNLNQEIRLTCFCLMPNHFHLLLYQKEKDGIAKFMRSIGTRYTKYFNSRYNRKGGLYQSRYKAVKVDNDAQLLHLTRYIHLNPTNLTPDITSWYSSYNTYLGANEINWLHPQIVLDFFTTPNPLLFKQHQTYKQFVEGKDINSQDFISGLALDKDIK